MASCPPCPDMRYTEGSRDASNIRLHDTERSNLPMQRYCSIRSCPNPPRTTNAEWCNKHYTRWRRHGDPLAGIPVSQRRWREPSAPLPRFVGHVQFTDTCWLWRGYRNQDGYGIFKVKVDGSWENVFAHRWLYGQIIHPIPASLVSDHLCRVHCCVNPDHIEPVTSGENTLRGETLPARYAERTHCDNGHEYTPENTHIAKEVVKSGRVALKRVCRRCDLIRTWRKRGQWWKLLGVALPV